MDIEILKTLALKLQGEFLTSDKRYLVDEKILHAKLIDLHENAKKILSDHETLFERIIKTLTESVSFIETKDAANLCKDIFEYATLKESKNKNSNVEKRDDLTGLFERNKLEKLDITKYKKVSVAFIDLDNFKKINDKYGHDKGDVVIKQVASILNKLEKEGCWILRNHGARGDEFVVVFFDLEKEKVFELMENPQKEIESKKGENFNATVSIGIASYPDDGENKDDVIKKADEALYFSKEKGKNCMTMYSEDLKKEIEYIQFRLEEIANIRNGSKILVKSWRCHHPPNMNDLEAVELVDLDEDIPYTSRNKGTTMTIMTIEKEIRGVVTEVKRPPGQTLFKLTVQKKQLEGVPSNPRDFLNPLFRY